VLEGAKVRQVRRSIGVGRNCKIGLVYMMRDVIYRLDKLEGTKAVLRDRRNKVRRGRSLTH
jgi:hypothetical protein